VCGVKKKLDIHAILVYGRKHQLSNQTRRDQMTRKELTAAAFNMKAKGKSRSATQADIIALAVRHNVNFGKATPQHMVAWVYSRDHVDGERRPWYCRNPCLLS
jgi:hypothetical protein